MPSPQDKICNVLTLLGLLSVIAWGTSSLLPDTSPESEPEEAPTVAMPDTTTVTETMEELPAVADPVPEVAEPDTLLPDTLTTGLPTDEETTEVAGGDTLARPAGHHSAPVHPTPQEGAPGHAADTPSHHPDTKAGVSQTGSPHKVEGETRE